MKDKNRFFPFVFLIFGIILILTISLVSVKRYIKQSKSENNFKNVLLKEKAEENNDEKKLFFKKPEKFPGTTSIKIYKERRVMELYGDNELIGRFKMALGRVPEGKKQKEGDNKTPEGNYYICYINSETKYNYFLGISYPNIEDARRGLNEGIIDKNTFERIKKAIENKEQPPWNTPLGGTIGIHGGGAEYNWTYGCIALSDNDMDILKQYVFVKTLVQIYK
ncbi:murein L,D-transpeptidase family protein [Clostridium sp. BJN0013]|uniref:murein L,D-transpeptidase family protein n=1 Tax=Clostridium sp. BJN0013 TaxID=3236840 RepID=UPI0034C67BB7